MNVWISVLAAMTVGWLIAALGTRVEPGLRWLGHTVTGWTSPRAEWSHPAWQRYQEFLVHTLSQLPATRQVSPQRWGHIHAAGVLLIGILGMAGGNGWRHPFALLGFMAAGAIMPLWWLRRAVRQRHAAIVRALPATLDLLTMMVETGLDVMAALGRVADRTPPGPWGEELTAVIQELHVGVSRVEALGRLRERVHHPWVMGLVAQLTQAIQMGASLSPLFQAQAKALREQWSHGAETRAVQAPIRLLAPLALLFLPAMLLVLLGPVVLMITNRG